MIQRYRTGVAIVLMCIVSIGFNILTPLPYCNMKSWMPGMEYKSVQYVSFMPLVIVAVVFTPLVVCGIRKLGKQPTRFVDMTLQIYLGLTITNVIVNVLKYIVGKERPDYESRIKQHSTGQVFLEGRRSFPSGHSAVAIASAVFVVYAGIQTVKRIREKGQRKAIVCAGVLLYALLACLVCASRIADNRHDIMDVVAGGAIAMCVCTLTVLQRNKQQ